MRPRPPLALRMPTECTLPSSTRMSGNPAAGRAEGCGSGPAQAPNVRALGARQAQKLPDGSWETQELHENIGCLRPCRGLSVASRAGSASRRAPGGDSSRARERAPKSYTLERLRRCSERGELRNLESRRQFRGNCVGRHVGATAVGGEGPSQGELCLIGIRGREIPARDRKVIRGERSGHKV